MKYEFKEQDAYDFARHVGAMAKPRGDELKFTGYCPYCNGGDKKDRDTFLEKQSERKEKTILLR